MNWFVIYSKPRQEVRAYENLLNQGFEAYLPTCRVQKIIKSKLFIEIEPMFSRYLFVRLDDVTTNWFPIRSTRGVAKLLQIGKDSLPIVVSDEIIQTIKNQEELSSEKGQLRTIFKEQELVEIKSGPFKGLNGFYQKLISNPSGEIRALLLIELLGKRQNLEISVAELKNK